MTKRGWIKIFRRELEWFKALSNTEIVYLLAARIATEWDRKNELFGTYDARIKEMQKLLGWADGTISGVTNALLAKGCIQKTEDHRRLRITNAPVFFSKGPNGKEAEKLILNTEDNLQIHELNLQIREYIQNQVLKDIESLKDKMSMRGRTKKQI